MWTAPNAALSPAELLVAVDLPPAAGVREWGLALAPLLGGDESEALLGAAALQAAMLAVVRRYAEQEPGALARAADADALPTGLRGGVLGDGPSAGEQLAGWLVLSALAHNPALASLRPLWPVDPSALSAARDHLRRAEPPLTGHGALPDVLGAPAAAAPDLRGQLAWAADAWADVLPPGLLQDVQRARGAVAEAHVERGWGPGPVQGPGVDDVGAPGEEPEIGERFSEDRSWMGALVLVAKQAFVWLHQLSQHHGRSITRLDAIPDAELDELASRGFTGLWLIGLWERSAASRDIKRRMGNPEAEASAYSLADYVIAHRLGGEAALLDLKRRAAERGIRLCADMVPNHVGIDGRWVVEHPERFVQLPSPPYPGYSFTGPDLCADDRVSIRLEDGYWDRSDAAVVFERRDTHTGDVRYLYHGNDGTQMPWNDTAQLDFLRPDVREAVIQLILEVARRFPVIRFDAAMTLARRHVQRLWHPRPGDAGGVPSRAEHGVTEAEFAAGMPHEFWREVVERVQEEVPDTLLLAEAFWMMEGYFVRNLGMHRVYNSAFMHMLRDEDNAAFRGMLREVLATSPAVLERFVNFANNPDEDSAAEQFGKGDKYFGVATLMATLPGLPMFGHGQVEGYAEKYGMEYARPYRDEQPDSGFVAHHETVIFPLLRRRADFCSAARFVLLDGVVDGHVDEDVIAFANQGPGGASLVAFNNRWREASCTLSGARGALGLPDAAWYGARELGRGWLLRSAAELDALPLALGGYKTTVLLDWRPLGDGAWAALRERLGVDGRVPDLDAALLTPPE